MTVYYWHSQGRLGNLLLQYAAIYKLSQPCDTIICFDTNALQIVKNDRIFINIKIAKSFEPIIRRLLHVSTDILVFFNVISSIKPEPVRIKGHKSERRNLVYKSGLFKKFFQVKGFFHHDAWIGDALLFDENACGCILDRLNGLSPSKIKIAVHIRLSDYKDWEILGKKDASLPIAWYIKAIQYIKTRTGDADCILFSDEPEKLAAMPDFKNIKVFWGGSEIEDLIAISLCDHVILSPSSFSFCAALRQVSPKKIILAPKYWLGFKSLEWYPPSIQSDRIHYLEVSI